MAEEILTDQTENLTQQESEQSPNPTEATPTLRRRKSLNELKEDYLQSEVEKTKEQEKAEKQQKLLTERAYERVIFLCFSVLAVILEILPYGVKMNFAGPLFHENIKLVERHYSYFSLIPLKYGVYGPFISAVFSCGVLYYILKTIASNKPKPAKTARNFAFFGFIFSLVHIIDLRYINTISVVVSLILFLMIFVYKLCVPEEQKYKEIKKENAISKKMEENKENKGDKSKGKKGKKEKKPKKGKKK